jgi:Neisseria PilC beta-propeller domain
MRTLKGILAASVQLLLVFVLSAGPVPLGIPRAYAGALPTDTPGIQSFYPPRLMIIVDTSKSMGYFPGDLNGFPGYLSQDWDPTTMTPIPNDPNCQSKFCLGKRALYVALPQYSSRIDMGLATYNQYYEIASNPPNFRTVCTYDEINVNSSAFGLPGTYFQATPTAIGDPNPNSSTIPGPVFTCTPPNAVGPHNCERNSVANNDATSITTTVLGSPVPYGPGSTMTSGSLIYTYWQKTSAVVQAPATSLPGGVCPAALTGYTGPLFGCTSAAPCDLNGGTSALIYNGQVRTYGANQGPSVLFGGNTYGLNSGQPATPAPFTTSCGVASPYTGGSDNCNSVIGGCTLTSSAPFLVTQTGLAQTYFNNINTPGPGWVITNTTAQAFNYQLTQVGQDCPPVNTVVTATSGPANWQFLATSNYASDHNWQTDPACDTSLQHTCTWTMVADIVGTGEIPQQFCQWQRTQYTWAPQIQQCTYTTNTWSYTYTPPPILTCSLKKWTVYFGRPSYWYTFQPNPGDLLGATNFTWNGNNDAVPTPTAVTYNAGSFTNGDCPNLIQNNPSYPPCNNGVACKLSWTSNTTIGVTNYPHGRWSNAGAGPFPYASPTVIYPSAEPVAQLTNGLFPPNPMLYGSNWLYGDGHGLLYKVDLYASIYDPSLTNPPPSQDGCTSCTYNYSYTQPPFVLSGDSVSSATIPWVDATTLAGNPNVAATSMPPNRTVGWSQEPPPPTGQPAVTWTAIAPDNAAPGGSPSTDGLVLRMLSKYDPVANPAGLRRPAYGDYTPLTGTMRDVKAYMQTVIDADPYAGCRGYYVMLLTDGEQQPVNNSLDPVAAVQAMRSPANGGTMMTSGGVQVDIKTFVIGFGLKSTQLDAMAQVGGTSVAADGVTPDPTGGAFQAVDYNLLLASLTAAFGNILAGYFTRSAPVANSVGDEVYIGYLKLLNNGREWQGYLDAENPDFLGPLGATSAAATFWQYSTSINAQSKRNLYIPLGNPSVAGPLSFFDYPGSGWNTNTTTDQATLQSLIDPLDPNGDGLATIQLLLNVGVPSGIFQYFRNTTVPKLSRASDIYHSVPVIVDTASQSQNWPDPGAESIAYKAFTNANKLRSRNIYIGANDGMLHALTDAQDSSGGQERWGYVPQWLLNGVTPNISSMRDGHLFGVDGSMAVADVCFGSGNCTNAAGTGWTTLLIGSLRQGGNALFALDITNPTAPQHLWQDATPGDLTASAGYMPRLGQTWSAPVIGRTTPATLGRTWSVFVGGGVGSGPDSATDPWGNAFFVLNAATGAVLNDGATSARFYVADDPLDPAKNNVAARPTLYRPSDGSTVDRVFFNDTEGKVWRMQVTSPTIANWTPGPTPFFDPASANAACQLNALGAITPITTALTGLPFTTGTTTLPLSRPRPIIYNRPALGLDPSGNVIVYVGTGDTNNPNNAPTQDYFYAVTDLNNGSCGVPLFILGFAPNEKVLSTPAFIGNNVLLTTYVPPAAGPNSCNDAGQGFLYSFDAFSGQPTPTLLDPITNTYVSRILVQVKDPNTGGAVNNLGIPTSPIVVTKNNVQSIIVGTEGGKLIKIGSNIPPVPWKMQGWERVR